MTGGYHGKNIQDICVDVRNIAYWLSFRGNVAVGSFFSCRNTEYNFKYTVEYGYTCGDSTGNIVFLHYVATHLW